MPRFRARSANSRYQAANSRNFSAFGDTEVSRDYVFSPEEMSRIRYNSGRVVSGTAQQVKQQLEKLAGDFEADELMVTTMSFDTGLRKRSFELLAEVFN